VLGDMGPLGLVGAAEVIRAEVLPGVGDHASVAQLLGRDAWISKSCSPSVS
jgi:hypothetical protein